MMRRFFLTCTLFTCFLLPSLEAQCDPGGGIGGVGSDLIVSDITNVVSYGVVGGYRAYSLGTSACNIGTAEVSWLAQGTDHPVWTQNLYRLEDGRFEQIGHSWITHGFFPLAADGCGCGCIVPGPGMLGVGCSTSNSGAINGNQINLGARSDVLDATLGSHPGVPSLVAPIADLSSRRLRIPEVDLDPALHPTASYFAEVVQLAPDDAAAGNAGNNASFRQVQVGPNFSVVVAGATRLQRAGIEAWAEVDPTVTIVEVPTPEGGRMILGYRIFDLGNGSWSYEYALQNLNSTRAGGSFSVPVPNGSTVSSLGFHGIEHHSGEIYDNTAWEISAMGSRVDWKVASGSNNALYWGSLYNFRFVVDAAPVMSDITVGLFTPGSPDEVEVQALAPASGSEPDFTRGDCGADGSVNIADAVVLLGDLFPPPGGPMPVECRDACDANDDGSLNIADAVGILSSLFGMPPIILPPPLACGQDSTADNLSCPTFASCP